MSFAEIKIKEGDALLKVFVKFGSESPTNEALDDYLNEIAKVYDRKCEFVILYDASNISMFITPTQLVRQSQFMRKRDQETRKYLVRCAIVMTSTVVRVMLQNLLKLKPAACELEIFDSLSAAQDYLRGAKRKD